MRMSDEVLTGEFEMGFIHLTEKEVVKGTDTGKYSIQMRLKPDSQTLEELQSKLSEFDQMNGEGWSPFKVGEGEYDTGFILTKAKSIFQPTCKNAEGAEIDPSVIRKGDKCRAIIKFAEFDTGTMKGNTVLLERVQRIADGRSGGLDFPVKEKKGDIPF